MITTKGERYPEMTHQSFAGCIEDILIQVAHASHQNVDSPNLVLDLPSRAPYLFSVRQVALVGDSSRSQPLRVVFPVVRPNFFDHRVTSFQAGGYSLDRVRIVVHADDGTSAFSEFFGERFTESRRCAGHLNKRKKRVLQVCPVTR